MAKRYLLTEPAFIAAALLTAGSVVTEADLGTATDPRSGKTVKIKPPASSIEIDEAGHPLDTKRSDEFFTILAQVNPAAAMPFSPVGAGAVFAQGVGAQPPGGPQFAANSIASAPVAVDPDPPRRRGASDTKAEAAALAALGAGEGAGAGAGAGSGGEPGAASS